MTETTKAQEGSPLAVIAGGSGFIGRRLAAVLAGMGWRIAILTRSPHQDVGPVHFVRWSDPWPELLNDTQAVINLCGQSIGGPRWTDERKQLLMSSRVEPTRALVNAINGASSPPAVFLQASGVGYYGTGNRVCDEGSGQGNDFLAELAAAWEAPTTELRADVRSVVARCGVVLGRHGGALGQMLLPFRLFVGGPIASGNQWLSWIHLHDAVDAMAWMLESEDAQGVYNVCAPNPVRNAEFARAAAAALKRPSWMFTPRVVLRALLGEQATLVCDGQNATPQRLKAEGFRFSFPTIEAALADLV